MSMVYASPVDTDDADYEAMLAEEEASGCLAATSASPTGFPLNGNHDEIGIPFFPGDPRKADVPARYSAVAGLLTLGRPAIPLLELVVQNEKDREVRALAEKSLHEIRKTHGLLAVE